MTQHPWFAGETASDLDVKQFFTEKIAAQNIQRLTPNYAREPTQGTRGIQNMVFPTNGTRGVGYCSQMEQEISTRDEYSDFSDSLWSEINSKFCESNTRKITIIENFDQKFNFYMRDSDPKTFLHQICLGCKIIGSSINISYEKLKIRLVKAVDNGNSSVHLEIKIYQDQTDPEKMIAQFLKTNGNLYDFYDLRNLLLEELKVLEEEDDESFI